MVFASISWYINLETLEVSGVVRLHLYANVMNSDWQLHDPDWSLKIQVTVIESWDFQPHSPTFGKGTDDKG